MNTPRHLVKGTENDQMDRRLIRVEFPLAQAGIAAALRRAFQEGAAPVDPCEREFNALLARLN